MPEKQQCVSLFVTIWLLTVFIFTIILISTFSSEIQQLKSVQTVQSKYDTNSLLSFSDSLSNAYTLANLGPIEEIYMVSLNSTCVSDDELLNLQIWNSKKICSSPFFDNFSLGECPGDAKSKKNKNEFTIDEQRVFLTNWFEVQFCVKRLGNWYFAATCQNNETACQNNICVKGAKCPINSLLIADLSNSSLQINTSEYTYNAVGFIQNQRKLFASRNYNSPFIVDLAVSINGKPCINEVEANKRSKNLTLLMNEPNNCANYGNDANIYTQLDIQQEQAFYEQNNVHYIMGGLNLSNFTLNESASLYSVVRPTNTCPQGNFLIDSDNSDITSLITLRNGSNSFGLIFLVFIMILFIIHCVGMFVQRKFVDSQFISVNMMIFIFVEAIMCPISLKHLHMIVKNDKFLNEIIGEQCFQNSGYNQLFSDFGRDILIDTGKVSSFIFTALYFVLVAFLLFMMYFIDKVHLNMFFDPESKGVLEEITCCNDDNSQICEDISDCIDGCC